MALAYALSLCIGYLIYRLANSHQTALRQACHDQLTGLPNRLALLEKIKTLVSSAEDDLPCGILCILDLDQFKISLLERADNALYASKKASKDAVTIFPAQ